MLETGLGSGVGVPGLEELQAEAVVWAHTCCQPRSGPLPGLCRWTLWPGCSLGLVSRSPRHSR